MFPTMFNQHNSSVMSNCYNSWKVRFYFGGEVVVIQEQSGLHLGSHVWEGSEKLSNFLQKKFVRDIPNVIEDNPQLLQSQSANSGGKPNLRGKRVIELGAGCGLIGIVLKKLFPSTHVTITDKKELIPLIRKNLELNGLHDTPSIEVRELEWYTYLYEIHLRPLPHFALTDSIQLLS